MTIWSGEIKELEKYYESFKDHLPFVVRELEQLIKTQDANVVMLYSRRCLEVIITDLCEIELKRPRKTEPLKGIIDKLHSEEKVPSHIISSMLSLNSLSTFGTHPKDFDPEQVKPVLNNLAVIIKWYLKYKDFKIVGKNELDEEKYESIDYSHSVRAPKTQKNKYLVYFSGLALILFVSFFIFYDYRKSENQEIPVGQNDSHVSVMINSEYGKLNDSIKHRLMLEGYILLDVNPQYKIEIISAPPGDPIAINGNAEGFEYFYDSTEVQIRINEQTPFNIGITVPKTVPMPSYQEARAEYKKNNLHSINNNFEVLYTQIKKHVPEK